MMTAKKAPPFFVQILILLSFILPIIFEFLFGNSTEPLFWIIHLIPAILLSYYFGFWGGFFAAIISPLIHIFWGWINHSLTNPHFNEHEYANVITVTFLQILISTGIGILSSSLKKKQTELEELMNKDPLTGVYNRRYFQTIFSEEKENRYQTGMTALMLIDLDRFKLINDTMGHQAGDQILIHVADRLKDEASYKNITVARLGGDEFALIAARLSNIQQAESIALHLNRILSRSYYVMNREINLSASIGVSIYPNDSKHYDTIVQYSDLAMYEAKKQSGTYRFFTKNMLESSNKRNQIEVHLKHAIALGEMTLHYQPKIDLVSSAIVGYEALLRWESPVLGKISPIDFIPLAEQTGIIHNLGAWTLFEACKFNQGLIRRGQSPLRVAVNISAKQLMTDGFEKKLSLILNESRMSPSLLELELTESVFMEGQQNIVKLIHKIREMGITISIDDFGAGYSSFGYLKQIPADILKIDKSFVQNMFSNERDAAIVKCIIDIGHILSMKVVAEGIETEEQCLMLKELGCDFGQGYFLGQPMNERALEQKISVTSFR